MNFATLQVKPAIVIAAVAMMALTAPAGANQLANAGFETGGFGGWVVTVFGSAGVDTDGQSIPSASAGEVVNVHSGSFAAYAAVAAARGDFITYTQLIAVNPSTSYDVGYFVGLDSPIGAGFNTSIAVDGSFLSITGNGPIVAPGDGLGSLPSDMRHVFGTFLSGAAQTAATVVFTMTGSGTLRAGFSFDDFHFNGPEVPVPATLALLGLGLIAMGWMRRRSAT